MPQLQLVRGGQVSRRAVDVQGCQLFEAMLSLEGETLIKEIWDYGSEQEAYAALEATLKRLTAEGWVPVDEAPGS